LLFVMQIYYNLSCCSRYTAWNCTLFAF
jgi:hypothetical protein